MRRRLLSAATALIVAIGGVAVAPAKPASAVDVATIIQVYTYVKKAYGYWKDVKGFLDSGGSSGMSVEQATNLIINEIRISRTEIINTMTNIATADVRACATHHVIEFADIASFSPVVLQQWAQDATSCVTRIASLYTALPATSYAARNDLGNALGAVGPIALIARARAGFSTEGLTNVLVQAFERVAQTFVPYCYLVPDGYNYSDEQWPSQPIYILTSYHCFAPGYPQVPGAASAYNYAWWQVHVFMDQTCVCGAGSPNYAAIDGRDLYALTNATTSRGIALDALAKLR
jgi:hypothetical protein